MTNTLIVNLFGGPSSGKSTMASGLFCLLKMHGVECEFVTEFAKDLVWEERFKTLKDQQYIFGKQFHKIWRLLNKVDVIITDSPLLLSVVYMPKEFVNSFTTNVVDTTNTLNNLNIMVDRNNKYNSKGRIQNENQAKEIDTLIKQKLLLYNMNWKDVYADHNGINELTHLVLQKLGSGGDLEYYINYGDVVKCPEEENGLSQKQDY